MQDSGALPGLSRLQILPRISLSCHHFPKGNNLSKENRAEETNVLLELEEDLAQGPGPGIANVLGYPAGI